MVPGNVLAHIKDFRVRHRMLGEVHRRTDKLDIPFDIA
jgi:hypothetical protein